MSGGIACKVKAHRPQWYVALRYANFSAFNGYHYTPSDYSEIRCPACASRWRTKAAYVATLPNAPLSERVEDWQRRAYAGQLRAELDRQS